MENVEVTDSGLLILRKVHSMEWVRRILEKEKLRGLKVFIPFKSEDGFVDLDFLRNYNFISSLDVTSVIDFDFSFLKELRNLRELSINTLGDSLIDLSQQTQVEILTLKWRKNIIGLENLNVRSLCVIEFKERDLIPLEPFKYLEDLKIKTSSILSLKGINRWNLKSLFLGNCKSLKDIDELNNLKIESLEFVGCSKISNFNLLKNLEELRNLQINDCKNIDSISFVDNFPKLTKLTILGNTNIVDGDMFPTKRIPEVLYGKRRHYFNNVSNKNYDNLIKENLNTIKRSF